MVDALAMMYGIILVAGVIALLDCCSRRKERRSNSR